MAFTNLIIVTTALVAVAFADYNWPYNQGQMPGYNAFPNFGFPHLNLPNPPPFPNFNFQSFPQVPQFDITKVKPVPGQIFNGVAVQSSSSVKRDKDGNVIHNGVSSLLTNDNGVVHSYEVPQYDITRVKPVPGQIYNGVSVQSSSSVKRDKDGNVIKNGGSSLLTNDNGVVHRYEVGDTLPYNGDAKVFTAVRDE